MNCTLKPLSFVIITYNRPDDALALLQNITTLRRAPELLEEVIVLNNASTVSYESVKQFTSANRQINFKYIDSPENLGVARGRNLAISQAKAPLLILLDDDAELQNADALENIVQLFEQHNDPERPLAILSFKVLYYENLQMQVNALPHKKFYKYKDQSFFYTYYYAGGAHAIRKDVLEQVGQYPQDFFYGMEEYDLSYRILDKGYSIAYTDKVVMLHKESPLGRKPKKEKHMMNWLNKSKVAWRYLPKKYFVSTAIRWSLHYLKKSGGDLAGFLRGWKAVLKIPKQEWRRPVSSQTLDLLHKVEARLWY
jgi:GT2 family glycosyltransferase